MSVVVEDRKTRGWPRGFGSVKRAQQLGRELQPVLRDALRVLAAIEQGVQGRYRISKGEKLNLEEFLAFVDAALDGTYDQEVEIIVVARDSAMS